jgi:hypothetical protein
MTQLHKWVTSTSSVTLFNRVTFLILVTIRSRLFYTQNWLMTCSLNITKRGPGISAPNPFENCFLFKSVLRCNELEGRVEVMKKSEPTPEPSESTCHLGEKGKTDAWVVWSLPAWGSIQKFYPSRTSLTIPNLTSSPTQLTSCDFIPLSCE